MFRLKKVSSDIFLFWFWRKEVLRYGELKRLFGNITHKMLSKQLKELEEDELIIRKEYPQVSPKVEYFLSSKGQSMMLILHALCDWRREYGDFKES